MRHTNTSRRLGAAGLSLLAGLCLSLSTPAQPVTGQIIDRVVVSPSAGCFDITIGLTVPMLYVSHFPAEEGDLLRIRLKPAMTEPVPPDISAARESARPNVMHGSPLISVSYEGDTDEPGLIVQFTHVVTYSVMQGDDFRSLRLRVRPSATAAGTPCQPARGSTE